MIFETLFERYPCLVFCKAEIKNALDALMQCYKSGGKLLCCGNGGSAADCDHLVGELMKGFLKERPLCEKEKEDFDDEFIANSLQKGLPAISLCAHTALMTAFGNDAEESLVFAQQVYAYAQKNDVLVCFSTSGNSENVVFAAKTAKAAKIKTVSITGKNESELSRISDVCIRLPETETFKIQELTLPVYHCLAAAIEEEMF